jgi:hypothetical protein
VREEIVTKTFAMDTMVAVEILTKGFRDPEVDVRLAAVGNAYMITDRKQRATLLRPLLSDSSYNVTSAALGTLALTDTTGLEVVLRRMKGMRGRRDRLASAWLNAVASAQFNTLADDAADYTLNTFNANTRALAYHTISRLDTTTPVVRAAIERGLREPTLSIRSAAATAARAHLDPEMRAILERLRTELTGKERGMVEGILEGK